MSADYHRLYQAILHHGGRRASAAADAAAEVLLIAAEVDAARLTSTETTALRFMCSSAVLNCAFDLRDTALLGQGRDLAEQALAETAPDEPLRFQCLYNVANALASECDFGLPGEGRRATWVPQLVANRLAHRVQLRKARKLFFEIGTAQGADPHTRSAAYCNLANSLDHSGRWAEAYDFYLRALDENPDNGNAAGNLAQLLQGRIGNGTGQLGHLAAVYDKYVTMAQSLRAGTVSFAGEATADRWDALELTESEGHLSHGLDDDTDEYRIWVAAHRLALSPAVEGLGTEEPHWDGAVIEQLYGTTAADVTPPILAEMNVLKSDFLVSRRLAFDGVVQIAEGLEQKADDSGYYVETLDHSLYGTQYSRLLLSQRSALDVLDKTAVVVNEYLNVGDRPDRVSFRKFWSESDGSVRANLVQSPARAIPAFALSELGSLRALAGAPKRRDPPDRACGTAGRHGCHRRLPQQDQPVRPRRLHRPRTPGNPFRVPVRHRPGGHLEPPGRSCRRVRADPVVRIHAVPGSRHARRRAVTSRRLQTRRRAVHWRPWPTDGSGTWHRTT
ncbi:LA2681 family HEPN domain-containing protein [Dactylosporangium salmoneum]|uniref:LA2681-like HEPN domain-containing protein n=1 Tax=Dactylosporangium salmoneum TaxID=53361 RepID=A0ABP5TG80_9ACTN